MREANCSNDRLGSRREASELEIYDEIEMGCRSTDVPMVRSKFIGWEAPVLGWFCGNPN